MSILLDHLVVGAASLEQGVSWCERTLGVAPAAGGRHARMGTHNRLLRISSPPFPDCYLEIIAIDPVAPAPGRPRWFGLDDPAVQAGLADQPRLLHVVARSQRLDASRERLLACGLQPGEPLEMSRASAQGEVRWRILVRPDGMLLLGGALPTLIEWQGVHPAASLPDSGVTLCSVSLGGLPSAARHALHLQDVEMPDQAAPAISAVLDTPLGRVQLASTA
jgi:hypothetical protein